MQKTVGDGFLHILSGFIPAENLTSAGLDMSLGDIYSRNCVKTVTFTKDLRKNPLIFYARQVKYLDSKKAGRFYEYIGHKKS